MRPLRMKDSTSADEAVLRAQHRAARKSKKRSTRTRSRSESLTPPRNPPKPALPHEGPEADDWGFDESAQPPEQAYKRSRDDDEAFEASLADAEAQDRGVGFYEDSMWADEVRRMPSYATHYGSAASAAVGVGRSRSQLAAMDEDEYAEYVRAGIWRIKNREEVERRERVERERKAKEEKEAREREKVRREESARIRRLEERRARKSKEDEEGARKRYEEAWKRLQQPATSSSSSSSATTKPPAPSSAESANDTSASSAPSSGSSTPYPLRFTDFPWPLYPPLALPPLSWPAASDLTAPAISSFLLDPSYTDPSKHKAILRQAVLAYHPDRFERFVLRIPEEKEEVRERVRALGLRTSQVLNELLKQKA
ncbi:hypothetical protein JCM8097_001633 [Rhodosporidiobolus ruineniae]